MTQVKHENATTAPARPLLVLRKDAAKLLACSISKLIKLEQAGRLTPIKLTGSANSIVHYKVEEVEALASGRAE